MLTRICLFLALLGGIPIWAQVVSPVESAPAPGEDDQMIAPPPVSGDAYPAAVGSEVRSNFLHAGLYVQTAYIDNFEPGGGGAPLSETTYSIQPTISFNRTSARQIQSFSYTPGFIFYQPSTVLDQTSQGATLAYQLRMTPHTTISVNDSFQDSSAGFLSPDSGIGGTVSGSSQSVTPAVVPPFADELSNSANAEFSVQTGKNTMVGVSGITTLLHYPNPNEAAGLYGSSSRGGSAFYNRRISMEQYIGATYQFSDYLTNPVNATDGTLTQTMSFFYTIYPTRRLSLSVSGGPQYYKVSETSLPSFASWAPSVMASMGWQGDHTSFAGSYSRQVTGGGGLLGAFDSTNTNVSARWQLSRTLTASANAVYTLSQAVTPLQLSGNQGGSSVSGGASVGRSVHEQFRLTFDYVHVHESYIGVASLANNPDSNRESVSLSWQFTRPLGR